MFPFFSKRVIIIFLHILSSFWFFVILYKIIIRTRDTHKLTQKKRIYIHFFSFRIRNASFTHSPHLGFRLSSTVCRINICIRVCVYIYVFSAHARGHFILLPPSSNLRNLVNEMIHATTTTTRSSRAVFSINGQQRHI